MTTYTSFNRRSPTETDPGLVQAKAARANFMALAAAMVMGGTLPGWNYTDSVTRGEGSPGTHAQPARMYFNFATDTKTVWVRVALTWSSGYPTKMVFSFSDDGEASYDSMDDLFGNGVLNISYDGSNYVTAMTWAKS